MRCYFMRNGHIQAVEEFFGLSEEEATVKAHALFSERKHPFEGFELWDHARFLTRHPGPGADEPLGDDPGIWSRNNAAPVVFMLHSALSSCRTAQARGCPVRVLLARGFFVP
jgi:hypothetical protein